MPNVAPCGDCTSANAYCAPGGYCFGTSETTNAAQCGQMCCTDADCGSGQKCDTGSLSPALPNNVGICD